MPLIPFYFKRALLCLFINPDSKKIYLGLRLKCQLSLFHFNKIYISLQNLNNKSPIVNSLIYIQQDATLLILFYLETALNVSGGTTTHHQERKQLYLQHLLIVTPLLLPDAIVEELELGTPPR